MYKEISKFIIYRDASESNILSKLGKIFKDFESGADSPESLRTRIYAEVRRLLEIATKYGFDNNLWHNYLTFLIITDENPFSLTYEKAGKQEGTVNGFAINDFCVFKSLFDFDFAPIEKALEINCSTLSEADYNDTMRTSFLIEKYTERGGRLFTIGSDSHFYKDAGFGTQRAGRFLKNRGIDSLCVFKKRKMSLVPLVTE